MLWTDIARLDQATIDALRAAGIDAPIALAAVDDEAALAQRAGLDPARVAGFCAEARAHVERALESAGVNGPEPLARADPVALAAQTGLPLDHLRNFVQQARLALGLPDEPPAAKATVPEAPPLPDAVLLTETSSRARVRVAGGVREDVPIVTARADDDVAALLAAAGEDAVLLQERAAVAPVKLAGQPLAPLPIFRTDDGAEERVRVAALKAHAAAAAQPAPQTQAQRSLLGRFLGRRNG